MGSINDEEDDEVAAKKLVEVVSLLNGLFPELTLPAETSMWDLRVHLFDGSVFYGILRRLNRGAMDESRFNEHNPSEKRLEILKLFLSVVKELGLPSFQLSDLEKGNLSAILDCLLSLRSHLNSTTMKDNIISLLPRCRSLQIHQLKHRDSMDGSSVDRSHGELSSPVFGDDKKSSFLERKIYYASRSLASQDATIVNSNHAGYKLHEVFPVKQRQFSELNATKISEIMKPNSLDNAPTQSLLSVANGILDESIERKNGELPQRVACLLKKAVQEIERRITTQAEHIRHQSNLMKTREEKYLSRIEVLETLAKGTCEGLQAGKKKMDELKRPVEEQLVKLMKEKGNSDSLILELKQDLESTKRSYEEKYQHLELESSRTKLELKGKMKDVKNLLGDSRRRAKELESYSEIKFQNWNQKEHIFNRIICLELQSLKDLRASFQAIKVEIIDLQERWREEIACFGMKLKVLINAAENYQNVFLENRKLYNEIQELKGNIRVCCRIRPILSGENSSSSIIDFIGENGELAIVNPSKQGKDGQKLFKFNRVFGPAATQEDVFSDIRPFVRSVLDGYNVCIFAYGQTGSGKTYTMNGPNSPSKEERGVNFRALNDLFHLSRSRRSCIVYEVGVQMIEIYNEQIRDLLSNDASQRRLEIVNRSQSNGLAVPDASMHSVDSTSDVLELMQNGEANRAISATALNQNSSRSHSVVTIHVRGTDLKTGTSLQGSLHLVDLAGSERVDRSEVTGDRLKETQHINKSLSALGDVIFALSQKSAHVPYRNSKLTQVLQSSLGGHAKTLMFVQINPDIKSYSESFSALKFAERVSGVELGAARSNKESKDVKNLMEQVTLLKESIERKDEEIEHLHMAMESGSFSSIVSHEKQEKISSMNLFSENYLNNCGKHSEVSLQHSADDKQNRENLLHLKLSGEEPYTSSQENFQMAAIHGANIENGLSFVFNGNFSKINGLVSAPELPLHPEQSTPIDGTKEKLNISKALQPKIAQVIMVHPNIKDSSKSPTSLPTKGALKSIAFKDGLKSPSLKNPSTTSQANLPSTKLPSKRWQQ